MVFGHLALCNRDCVDRRSGCQTVGTASAVRIVAVERQRTPIVTNTPRKPTTTPHATSAAKGSPSLVRMK